LVMKMAPDKNKTLILKYYSMVSKLNAEILGSGTYSGGTDGRPKYLIDEYPVSSGSGVSSSSCSGFDCSPDSYPDDLVKAIGAEKNDGKYYTADGTVWTVAKDGTGNGLYYTIKMDLNNGGSGDAVQSNKNPNVFRFKVDNWGLVSGGDYWTQEYLKDPLSTIDKR